jgi:hypothetical protein
MEPVHTADDAQEHLGVTTGPARHELPALVPPRRAPAARTFGSPRRNDLSYVIVMSRVYSARVRGGVVVPDGVTLPDGTAVTIAVNDEREAEVQLTPAELSELDDAMADADRSESVSSAVVLAELDRIARDAR